MTLPVTKRITRSQSRMASSSGAVSHDRLGTISLEDRHTTGCPKSVNEEKPNKPTEPASADPIGAVSHNRLGTMLGNQMKPGCLRIDSSKAASPKLASAKSDLKQNTIAHQNIKRTARSRTRAASSSCAVGHDRLGTIVLGDRQTSGSPKSNYEKSIKLIASVSTDPATTRSTARAASSGGAVSHDRLSTRRPEDRRTTKTKGASLTPSVSSGAVSHDRLGTQKLNDLQGRVGTVPNQNEPTETAGLALPAKGAVSHYRLGTVKLATRLKSSSLQTETGKTKNPSTTRAATGRLNSNGLKSCPSMPAGTADHNRLGVKRKWGQAKELNRATANPDAANTSVNKNSAKPLKPNACTAKCIAKPPTSVSNKHAHDNQDSRKGAGEHGINPADLNSLASEIKHKLDWIIPQLGSLDDNTLKTNTIELVGTINEWIHLVTNRLNDDAQQTVAKHKTEAAPYNSDPQSLMSAICRPERVKIYKSKNVKDSCFDQIEQLPEFNTGRKPLNPANPDLLDRMLIIDCNTPEEFAKLDTNLDNAVQVHNGTINIDKFDVNKNGKATIICESLEQKTELASILRESGFIPRDAQRKNFMFALFGIPKHRSSELVLNEMKRKNPRKFNGIEAHDRFSMNSCSDVVVISCNDESRIQIVKKPLVYLGKRVFKLKNFIELTQCFKCSKFGHKSEYCQADKLSCPNCSEDHELKSCPVDHKPKCGNCSSLKTVSGVDHASWDVRCPYRKLWISRQRDHSYG